MSMKKVRVLREFRGYGARLYVPGEVVSIRTNAARALVTRGEAEWYEDPPPPEREPRTRVMMVEILEGRGRPLREPAKVNKPPKQPTRKPPQTQALETPPELKDEVASRCRGITNSGKRCKRTGKLNEAGFCPLHKNQEE